MSNNYTRMQPESPVALFVEHRLIESAKNWRSSVSEVESLKEEVKSLKSFINETTKNAGPRMNLDTWMKLRKLENICASLERHI